MNRTQRLATAQETVRIVERGAYALPDGRTIDLSPAVRACVDGTRLYEPNELSRLRREVLARPTGPATRIEVCHESTLAGVARLAAEGPVAALNFASAKNPGGGFLNGSEAQEESLARSSALYASLLRAPDFYDRHRALASCLYTDAMIVSPACPVFRDDAGRLLESPHGVTFVTSPAPNAGAVARNAPHEVAQIGPTLRRRAALVLALAAHLGHRHLVLGAWGCGVFRNDPDQVAAAFAEHLRGEFAGRFERVTFSVLDGRGGRALAAFESAFAVPTPTD